MGNVAYVDMIGGAAGDMLMAAWIDAGVDAAELERALRGVVADGWEMAIQRVSRGGISALHLDLVIPGEDDHAHHGRHRHAPHGHRLCDIIAIVERSGLTRRQIDRATAIYRRLAQAEARIANQDAEEMLFHDFGQLDAILDVAGTCVALDLLEVEELRCSPFPIGHGFSRTAHGVFANPAPEALELMRGFPVRAIDIEADLVTATGAAILTTLLTPGPAVDMTLERVGYGAGRKTFDFPNVVRVSVGTR